LCFFAIQIDNDIHFEPKVLEKFLGKTPSYVYVLQWYKESFKIEFFKNDELEKQIELLNKEVNLIDSNCPFCEEHFKVKGPGEGLVLYPLEFLNENGSIDPTNFSLFVFKAKGTKHQVIQQKNSVQKLPEKAKDVENFVKMFVTENRLEQGLEKLGKLDKKLTKEFVEWVKKDVEKESKSELEVSGLEWNKVQNDVGKEAAKWFGNKFSKKE